MKVCSEMQFKYTMLEEIHSEKILELDMVGPYSRPLVLCLLNYISQWGQLLTQTLTELVPWLIKVSHAEDNYQIFQLIIIIIWVIVVKFKDHLVESLLFVCIK